MNPINTEKVCLWCGNTMLTYGSNVFPRHPLCEVEMEDKGVKVSLVSVDKNMRMCLFNNKLKLRIELNEKDIARKVWKTYEKCTLDPPKEEHEYPVSHD